MMDRRFEMTPRLANGRKMYFIGEGYAVLVDSATDRERSERKPVGIWIGWNDVHNVTIIPEPLDTNEKGRVVFTATGYADKVMGYIEGDGPVCYWANTGSTRSGQEVILHFDYVWEAMQ